MTAEKRVFTDQEREMFERLASTVVATRSDWCTQMLAELAAKEHSAVTSPLVISPAITGICCRCGKPAVTAFDNDEFCAVHADADPRGVRERDEEACILSIQMAELADMNQVAEWLRDARTDTRKQTIWFHETQIDDVRALLVDYPRRFRIVVEHGHPECRRLVIDPR